mmetsp:Transcript_4433/g.5134  ORF Transcript_4433/g.5134 Transcript_4433/m.5134 type:complete len:1168 (-) Transcript_4433:177-3680(-)
MMVLSALEGRRKENMNSSKPYHRRRRSKGTIAGFVSQAANAETENGSEQTNDNCAAQTTTPQHVVDATTTTPPSHSARLALLCTQNSISLGAKTQLCLCPPGRNRRNLQMKMRGRTNRSTGPTRSKNSSIVNGGKITLDNYYSLEKMIGEQALKVVEQEENYLLSTNTFDFESDEESSSGDEDDLDPLDDFLSDHQPSLLLDNGKKYENLKEPLFTSVGTETTASTGAISSMNPNSSSSSGRLPFNHRKIRYFDAVTASERATAREYLVENIRKTKRRDGIILARHLRRMHCREKRRQKIETREQANSENSDDYNDDDEIVNSREESLLVEGVNRFQSSMTAPLSAALLLESLTLNPVESVEGMAKCYDGIVAAGDALLGMDGGSAMNSTEDGKPKAGRAEVLEALGSVLISSLEQPSGEVILCLASLRRLCGTSRYQRRFVQRVAPCLIRPPRGAIWCLKHQHDMESILAASELIFDSAHSIFSNEWYEKGRQLLADSVRKETLNYAAQQLRDLSQENNAFVFSSHGHRRKLIKSGVADSSGSALAEWEVRAVDRQIRISISNILKRDWTKVSATARDSEFVTRNRRCNSGTTERRTRNSNESSSKVISSPRSPRSKPTKKITSPQNMYSHSNGPPPAPDVIESVFGPSFATQQISGSTILPGESSDIPLSPPPMRRDDVKMVSNPETGSASRTPPRSPASPPAAPPTGAVRDPMRSPPPIHSDPLLQPPVSTAQASPGLAPLSPQSSVSNASVSSDAPHHHRLVSSASSVASSGSSSQPAHYRMLTSTAAERKRTVAACRALRSQIQRFEEAFMQLHGRAPKGTAERAPLATTYNQYREWKRAIRADAACRIQALIRGASTRWMLLRSEDPRLAQVVITGAGRPRLREPLSKEKWDSISIPSVEESDRMSLLPVEGDIEKQTPPHWSQPQRHIGSDQRNSPSTGFSGNSSNNDLGYTSLAELQTRKRDLKQQLKQYDMNFARKHGRMPVKIEKEPIRHLYETYNSLKSRITHIEREGLRHNPNAVTPSHQISNQFSQARSISSQRTLSSHINSTVSNGAESNSSDELNLGPSMARRKKSSSSIQTVHTDTLSTPPGAPSQDLAALKAEKSTLHQMLRSYEKDFFKEHKRQVSSFADIKPVASQYRRYKEIKKSIAALQQQGRSEK